MSDIWDDLRTSIVAIVQRDGIKEDMILANETRDDVFESAVDNIYYDVAGFYDWYFNLNDPRSDLASRAHGASTTEAPVALVAAVRAVAEDNLKAMREADELDGSVDPDIDNVTADLVTYIVGWEGWFWDRKVEDAWDAYYENQTAHDELAQEGYGADIGGIYDGEDVPYVDRLRS